jgi:hypothetical protein
MPHRRVAFGASTKRARDVALAIAAGRRLT